jgi:phage shock protein A
VRALLIDAGVLREELPEVILTTTTTAPRTYRTVAPRATTQSGLQCQQEVSTLKAQVAELSQTIDELRAQLGQSIGDAASTKASSSLSLTATTTAESTRAATLLEFTPDAVHASSAESTGKLHSLTTATTPSTSSISATHAPSHHRAHPISASPHKSEQSVNKPVGHVDDEDSYAQLQEDIEAKLDRMLAKKRINDSSQRNQPLSDGQ